MALQAGNDMIVTTDYRTQIPAVIAAVQEGTLDESVIDDACLRYCGARIDLFAGLPKVIPDWILHENSLICCIFLKMCNQNVPFFVFPCEQLLERPVYGKGAFL